jgi:DNA-binding NtrC family response regulator
MDRILVVEDRPNLREMLRHTLEAEDYTVEEAGDGQSALEALGRRRFLAVLTDLKLPGADGHAVLEAARGADPTVPVILMTAYGTVEDAVAAMKAGAYDFLPKPVDTDHLLLLLDRAIERRRLVHENLLLREEAAARLGVPRIVGDSPALQAVAKQIQKVAPAETTVLLLGESGTGKELFARALHALSPRRGRPFVAINCAAIPENLLENELFGHEKGAYTGAGAAKIGKLELADKGTLFLDEVGELAPSLQAKLLRALQEKAFERVGGTRTIECDLRLVAATNRDLEADVAGGRFREDLYFRLSVFPLSIPPLRERLDDLPVLVEHILERLGRELGIEGLRAGEAALEALAGQRWPGNIRELENALERAAILAEGPELLAEHLGLGGSGGGESDLAAFRRLLPRKGSLPEVAARASALAESMRIREALEAAGGNKRRAAEALGVSYKTLLSKIQTLGLGEEDASS